MASQSWTPSKNAPATVDQLRKTLTQLAQKRSGKALIDAKFTRDHVYPGHKGSLEHLATDLAKYRGIGKSSLVLGSIDTRTREEVLNWIKNVPDEVFTFDKGTWTVAKTNSMVTTKYSYDFVTVHADKLRTMNKGDLRSKARHWMPISRKKQLGVACMFDTDGTPLIYHMEFGAI